MPYLTQAQKNASVAAWRKRNPDRTRELQRRWETAHPDVKAQVVAGNHAVNKALRAGTLVRPAACEECHTAGRVEAAHYDYVQLLEVRWLCRSCHVRWDRAQPKAT